MHSQTGRLSPTNSPAAGQDPALNNPNHDTESSQAANGLSIGIGLEQYDPALRQRKCLRGLHVGRFVVCPSLLAHCGDPRLVSAAMI